MKKTIVASLSALAAGSLLLFAAGCATTANNDRSITNLIDHFIRSGIVVDSGKAMISEVGGASEAYALTVAGREIGIYKYNTDIAQQRERLERITRQQYIFFIGLKFPVEVRGSFVLVGLDENPKKKELIAAFNTF